jgi:hypothetical protein
VIVNVCPAAVTMASPERVWDAATEVERLWTSGLTQPWFPPTRLAASSPASHADARRWRAHSLESTG